MDDSIKFRLQHQTQPCPLSCVTTSVAILAGLPVEEVREKYHNDYREGNVTCRQIFNDLGIPFQSFDSMDRVGLDICKPGGYFVAVPSLNIQGGMHQVVIEISSDGDWQILDPAQGLVVEGQPRLYYTQFGAYEGRPLEAVTLGGGYTIEAFIAPEHLPELAQH